MDKWDRRLTRRARVLLLEWPCLWRGNQVFQVGFMELFFEAWSDFANQGPCQPGYPGELHCAWTLRHPTLAVITRKGVPSLSLKTVSKFPISRFVPSLPKQCPTQAAWETLTNTHNLWRALYSIGCLHILSQNPNIHYECDYLSSSGCWTVRQSGWMVPSGCNLNHSTTWLNTSYL